MKQRVVVSGLGVVSPIGNTVSEFTSNLKAGVSGIHTVEKLSELRFNCQVAGVPQNTDQLAKSTFSQEDLLAMNSNMIFGCLAAVHAWENAGLPGPSSNDQKVDWDSGAIIGTGIGGMDTVGSRVVPLVDAARVRRLGSTCVEQVMASSVSAKVGGLLALGNQVTSNSSACTTGTEAIQMAAQRIRAGQAKRMLAGGSEGNSHYIWAAFDAMRVLARGYNDQPQSASRPMSASASGFVPACGAGVLLLESLEEAQRRGVKPLAEILGGATNCGGQKMGGSMTAPNSTGVQKCIQAALKDAQVESQDVDAISGHLTATMADPIEVHNWAQALDTPAHQLPLITSTKSLIGHALGAAGGIESVAVVQMLRHGFVHASVNCENLHTNLVDYKASIPHQSVAKPDLRILAKAGFGFGDVNSCLIFRKWE